MPRLPGRGGLLVGVVLLAALLAAGRALPLKKPRPRSPARLAEVSGGAGARAATSEGGRGARARCAGPAGAPVPAGRRARGGETPLLGRAPGADPAGQPGLFRPRLPRPERTSPAAPLSRGALREEPGGGRGTRRCAEMLRFDRPHNQPVQPQIRPAKDLSPFGCEWR